MVAALVEASSALVEASSAFVEVPAGAGRGARVFLARRSRSVGHGGLWELPGGKVESGETPENALAREILEELGVELVIEGPGTRYESRIGERAYVFLVFPARFSLAEGESVSLTVHDEWGFYSASELGGLNLAPLDGPALEDWINRKGLGRAPLRTGGEGRH